MEAKLSITTIIISSLSVVIPGFYGVLGSAGFYIHEIIQDPEAFDKVTFFMYCFLGFVIAMMFYKLPEIANVTHSSGFLIAAGFCVRKITEMAERALSLGIKLPKK